MKKFLSFMIVLSFFLCIETTSFAADEEPITLNGKNGSFSFMFETEADSFSRSSTVVSYETFGDHIEITVPLSGTDEDIYTELNLPEGARMRTLSSEPYEESVILLENNNGKLLGLVDIPIITLDDGTKIYGQNTIDNNSVLHSYDIDATAKEMTISIYVTREYSYYFYDIGYNDDSARHDFWMEPKGYIFVSEKDGMGTYEMSWNSLDEGMKSRLSSGDLPLWNNNLETLRLQYRCHYDIATPSGYWNLEHYRGVYAYDGYLLTFCNP